MCSFHNSRKGFLIRGSGGCIVRVKLHRAKAPPTAPFSKQTNFTQFSSNNRMKKELLVNVHNVIHIYSDFLALLTFK